MENSLPSLPGMWLLGAAPPPVRWRPLVESDSIQDKVQPMRRGIQTSAGGIPATPGVPYLFHFAAEYYDRGWSLLPLAGKQPAVSSWRAYQVSRPPLPLIKSWFDRGTTNIGIITGRVSGLAVVDCDTPEDASFWQDHFPPTPLIVFTGGGGRHFYYRYPDPLDVTNRIRLLRRRIDLRGNGGYVVAPPSRHPNGTCYRWQDQGAYCLDDVPVFSPRWMEQPPHDGAPCQTSRIRPPRSYLRSMDAMSGAGGHQETFRAACKLRDAGFTPEEALCELARWTTTNASPPWTIEALLHNVQSAYGRRGMLPGKEQEHA